MSKKRNNTVQFPDVANMDDLAVLSDEELAGRASRMEAERRRAASTMAELAPWEVEVAYIRREQQLREARAQAHTAYLATVGSQQPEPEQLEDFDSEVN